MHDCITDEDLLVSEMDCAHTGVCAAQLRMFSAIVRADRSELWREWGAHDMAHWLSMRYRVSSWHAQRWIATAHALEQLPEIAAAWARGDLGLDVVIELARFATPETEAELVAWARHASRTALQRRADVETTKSLEETQAADRSRRLSWWFFDEGRMFGLEAELPAAQGVVVARALERLGGELPVMPGEEDGCHVEARRADALVAMASARIAEDADPDRATVVVHASLATLLGGGNAEIEGGPAIHPETARRLACDARIQVVVENAASDVIGLGRMSREPAPWMMRQLRHRDGGCTFPGCGTRRFVHAHHITWWERGGRTDLDNLALVCSFHHKLVHEHGWKLDRGDNGAVRWFHPDGTRHRAAPGPPGETVETEQPEREPVLRLGAFRPFDGTGVARETIPQARSPGAS
ncbi:MAG: DUF222 domain-containing protein [Actinomycetota bacterium]